MNIDRIEIDSIAKAEMKIGFINNEMKKATGDELKKLKHERLILKAIISNLKLKNSKYKRYN